MKSGHMICAGCKAKFQCGKPDAVSDCWCDVYPRYLKQDIDTACLCQSCLKKESLQRINQLLEKFELSGKSIDMSKYQTNNNIEGIDYYIENGLIVFSEWYLIKRGYCCDNDCRHCPY